MSIHDNRTEFAQEFQETLQSCGMKSQPIAAENLRPNLVERVHRTLSDVIRTEHFEDVESTMREVSVLLSSCAWVIRSTSSVVTGNEGMTVQVAIDVSWSKTLRKKEKISKKITN